METNMTVLTKALHMPDSSIDNLATITMLTIPEIMELDTAPKRLIAYRAGRKAVELGIVPQAAIPWQESAAKGWRYDLWAYWRGVADATRETTA